MNVAARRLGEFNAQCLLEATEYPTADGGACLVSHAAQGDACQITSVCDGLTVLDPDALGEEIVAQTGSDNTEIELESLSMALTSLELSAPTTPALSDLELQADSVKEQPEVEIFTIGLGEAQDLLAGAVVEVLSVGGGDAFLAQVNGALLDEEELPAASALQMTVPLSEVQAHLAGQEVSATISYAVEAIGDGSLCYFGCGGGD